MRRQPAHIALALGFTALTASIITVLGHTANQTAAAAGIRTYATALPAPKLSALQVPGTLTAQQGHARFLVGVRTSLAAHIVVRITNVATKKIMNAITEPALHKAGRVFLLVQATDTRGFQLPAGTYSIFVGARAANGRNALALRATMHLVYAAPRGVLDWFTVPVDPDIRASLLLHMGAGQVVTAVNPGGPVANAGIVRGDVIVKINGTSVATPGGLATALRQLPANSSVPIVLVRGITTLTRNVTAPPDWTGIPSLGAPLAAAAKTGLFGYSYAQAAYDISTGNASGASKIISTWSKANGATALAQIAHAQLLAAEFQPAAALGYWNKALALNSSLSAAAFGQGLALDTTGHDPAAANAFAHAAALDHANASALAFEALAEEQVHLPYLAVSPALAAVALDPSDPNALASNAIALMQTGQPAEGIAALKRSLVLTDDQARAQMLITSFLEPAAP
jgi:hypothetical protein